MNKKVLWHQVLRLYDLSCFADNTYQTGGTGQAIRIAAAAGIEVFNLQDPAIVERIRTKVNF